jgi:hypothetical protein
MTERMILLSFLALLFRILITAYSRDLMGEHRTTDYGGYTVSHCYDPTHNFPGIANPGLPTM